MAFQSTFIDDDLQDHSEFDQHNHEDDDGEQNEPNLFYGLRARRMNSTRRIIDPESEAKHNQVDLPFLESMRGEFNPGVKDKRPSLVDDQLLLNDLDSKYCLVLGNSEQNIVQVSRFDEWTEAKSNEVFTKEKQEFWLDIRNANEDDLKLLHENQGIHSVTLGDILGGDNRERVEFFEDYMLVCLQMCHSGDPIGGGPFVTMLIFPNAIFTFHDEPAPVIRLIMNKMSSGTNLLLPDRVMYLLLSESLRVWIPTVHSAEDEVESLHDLALVLSDSDKNDTLLRMATSRRLITNIQRKLLAKRDVLRAISVGAYPFVRQETQPYLRDALDHLLDLLRIINASRDALNQLQANYLAKVSLDLADSAQKTNNAMKIFSLVATIGLPVNAISGILGMNVWYPGRIEVDTSGIPFMITILCMFAVSSLMFVLFRWHRLL